MNYGDKLRQMTNDLIAIEIVDNIVPLLDGDCGFHIETIHHYLNTKVETTGHEDLEATNWKQKHNGNECVEYSRHTPDNRPLDPVKVLSITPTEICYIFTHGTGYFTDEEIDFLRKCANKIRKEKGWLK